MVVLDADGRKRTEMDEDGRKWTQMDASGRKWTLMDASGRFERPFRVHLRTKNTKKKSQIM